MVPKQLLRACRRRGGMVRQQGSTGWDGYTGGYGEGYTGYYPAAARGEVHMTAKRAPEGLQGLEWVVICSSDARTHPSGPVGALQAPPWCSPGNAASGANIGEIPVNIQ